MEKKRLKTDFLDTSLKNSRNEHGVFSSSHHSGDKTSSDKEHSDKHDHDDLLMLSLRGLLMGMDSAIFNGGRRCRLRLLFQLATLTERQQIANDVEEEKFRRFLRNLHAEPVPA